MFLTRQELTGAIKRPVPLTLLSVRPAPPVLERRLHERFEHLRAHGEWFKDRAEIRREFGL